MNSNDKEINTIADLTSVIDDILTNGTREDAQAFMAACMAQNSHAAENIGYLSGYYDPETAAKIRDWFQVTHPIFGNAWPTREEAYEAGQRRAEDRKTER